MERVCWSDGCLVHVAHVGVLRYESFCGEVPALVNGTRVTTTVEGPATCLECSANEGRPRCKP